MSNQHHSSPEELEAKARMLDEFLGKSVPSFPRGRLNPDDLGELSFAIALDVNKRAVIIRYAKPVDWVGLDKQSALRMAELLKEKAEQL